jgi:thiol-disulfide isomerase/thioredoxin
MLNNHIIRYLLFFMPFISHSQSSPFLHLDLSEAKSSALTQNKQIFIHFTAPWCMPCKWMDEHTYTDSLVSTYLAQHYIPIKINIEETEGMQLKTDFGVTILPTIMITNYLAQSINKVESSMSAEQLLDLIRINPREAYTLVTHDLTEVKTFFTIQTGVFSEEKNAAVHQKDLKQNHNIDSDIVEDKSITPPVYRVYTGKFASQNEAVSKILILKNYGINALLKALN